jgi:hypothetical protein
MDPTRDNPIIRFTAFWWGLGIFLVFALLLAVIWAGKGGKPATDLEDVVAKARYETRAKVEKAQADALSKEAITAAMPAVAKKLAASKPVVAPVAAPAPVPAATPEAAPATAAPVPAPTPVPAPIAPQAPNP